MVRNELSGGSDGESILGLTSGSGMSVGSGVGMTGLRLITGEAAGEVRDAGSEMESGSSDNQCSKVIGVRGLECRPVREADLDAGFAGVRGRDSRPTRDVDLDVDGGGTIGM